MQKILVIGQRSEPQQSIMRLLMHSDYEPITVVDHTTAVTVAGSQRPDLVLCTADLDGIDSRQLLQEFQTHSDLSTIPFVLVTNATNKSYLRECVQLGADDCLTFPFTEAEISAAIAIRLQKQARVTEQYVAMLRNTAERLNRLAHYDSLTDLPNHHLLNQRLVQALERALTKQWPLALLSLSLDRLRHLNNTLGYEAGDALLQATARRLRASLPDGTTVARLTGNQFAILLPNYGDRKKLRAIAEELMNRMAQSFSVLGQEVFVTTSIGIALYPEHGQDTTTLLRQADAALELAKQQKSNYCQIYRSDIPVVASNQILLETWLRYALDRQEFEVYYQPQMALSWDGQGSDRIVGAEALIRWHHDQQGFISPGKFIPLAEDTGLIVPIGDWILRQTCQQTQTWQQTGLANIEISVNLSSVQFNQPQLSRVIAAILEQTGLPPASLELELTETALMQDAEMAVQILNDLKSLGIKLAIDDFGTGYSSLSYLKQFPIDTLKIDTCFVRGLAKDLKNQAILTAAIHMAHDLGLKVIAEGVETAEELEILRTYHCDIVQGYFIGKPMPRVEFEAFLAATTASSSVSSGES